MSEAKETKAEQKAEPKAKAAKVALVSMSVDGAHLIAGEPMPELNAEQQKKLAALFGDKPYCK